ncbi:MAG: SDR family oxidoreductase, partial [Bacteroidetes bacterium]|nr:SDR family oxidoreductase [Bacteroidota bacterium]
MNLPLFQTVLITGASSGIGKAIARRLAVPGRCMILVARSRENLDRVVNELADSGAKIVTVAMDITNPESELVLADKLKEIGKPLDLLVNNAGFGTYGFFFETPPASTADMIDLNVKSLVRLTHYFLPGMVNRNCGAIVNVSSVAGFQPVPFMAAYGATKAFVTSFSLALSAELRDTRVQVIALCPGRTKTNFQLIAGSHKVTVKSRFATADNVALVALKALESESAIAIEGWSNRIMTHAQRFFPRRAALWLAYKI